MVGGVELRGHHETTDFKGSHLTEIQKSGGCFCTIITASHLHVETSANKPQVSTFLLGNNKRSRKRMHSSPPPSKFPKYLSQVEPNLHLATKGLGNVVFSFRVSIIQKDKWKWFGVEVQKQLTISSTWEKFTALIFFPRNLNFHLNITSTRTTLFSTPYISFPSVSFPFSHLIKGWRWFSLSKRIFCDYFSAFPLL